MWFGLGCCVIAVVLGYVVGHFARKAETRGRREDQEREELDRTSGALPYDYVDKTKQGEK